MRFDHWEEKIRKKIKKQEEEEESEESESSDGVSSIDEQWLILILFIDMFLFWILCI